MLSGASTFASCAICRSAVDRARDLRWSKDGYLILACPSCGVLFRADLPTEAEIREVYGPIYFSSATGDTRGQGYPDYLGEESNHRANAMARLEVLERYGSRGRLLDVGCAAGFFLDEARKRGWVVGGVELATGMASYAQVNFGLPVRSVAFGDFEGESATFDVVTMWDYIEHSTDPVADLERAATLLRPGGLIALTTGDAGSITARVFGKRWHLMTPRHHNFFFTRSSLMEALRRSGYRVVSMTHESSRYSVAYLLHKLRTLHDSAPVRRVAHRLEDVQMGHWSVAVNLYDILTVIAERC